jgi:predicted PurR-regulated permease PerM
MTDNREDKERPARLRIEDNRPQIDRPSESLPYSNTNWQRALLLPLTILAWLVIGIIVLWLLGHIAHSLVVIILAVIVTFAVAPLVRLLKGWLFPPFAIAVAYLFVIGIVIGLGFLLVRAAAGQVINVAASLPDYINRLNTMSPQTPVVIGPFRATVAELQTLNQQALSELHVSGTTLASDTLSLLNRLASALVDVALVLILSIYFSIDAQRVVDWLRHRTPPRLRRYTPYFLGVTNTVVGGYVRGTLTMALIIGTLVGVGLQVLGVPYALLLGILAFFMQFVPIVGVFISGAVSLLVALPQGWGITLAVLVYFIGVHVLESYVIGPRLMGHAVGIHPAVGIIALLVGTEAFGIWGTLFAAPLAGLLQAIVIGIWRVQQSMPLPTAGSPVVIEEEQDVPAEQVRRV